MAEANTTTNHKEIQKWVESRGGHPARVKRTGGRGDPGILRIDYPGFSGEETLEQISWPEWFDAFEKNNLAFIYQDSVKGGSKSRFSKLVARNNVRSIGSKTATPRRGGAAKRTAAKRATTTRKTTRAAAARTSKRPTATKKRSAKKQSAKKQGAVKQGQAKRTSKKRSTSRR